MAVAHADSSSRQLLLIAEDSAVSWGRVWRPMQAAGCALPRAHCKVYTALCPSLDVAIGCTAWSLVQPCLALGAAVGSHVHLFCHCCGVLSMGTSPSCACFVRCCWTLVAILLSCP